ncbi:hypothetical protein, partial [Bradyrhizobium oropedii]|uniref:hypothetical protein n=1 Tax=Bradyrhizobium oropedii TaxID=1571201 RepID=UPI001E648BFA
REVCEFQRHLDAPMIFARDLALAQQDHLRRSVLHCTQGDARARCSRHSKLFLREVRIEVWRAPQAKSVAKRVRCCEIRATSDLKTAMSEI